MDVQPTLNIALGALGLLVLGLYGWFARRDLLQRPVAVAGLITAAVAIAVALLTAEVIAARLVGFWRDVVFESYGLLLDLVLVGGLLLWLLERGRKQQTVRFYLEEIGDLKSLATAEAVARITGHIRRLNRLGVSRVDLSLGHLPQTHLQAVNLEHARLVGAHLVGIRWPQARLGGADLQSANLHRAKLVQADLKAAILWGANLSRSDLRESDLQGANLKTADLQGADLRGAQLTRVIGLTLSQLAPVRSLYQARLDPGLADAVRRAHPHLLVNPEADPPGAGFQKGPRPRP